eukprot:TRINITY_DN39402_c1_g1_i1.p1 TRINITY_DN39402_c1_g1~~TRINITY_DN39402_c1_g1_i1.p1  ORF type:complete len:446 (+),score=112.40 TRINITY_DN39402_c1_g1_i1:271-1608(+)
MATRPVVPNQNRGGAAAVGNKKPTAAAEAKNRRALGDIGNLVNVRVLEGKPQQISRPVTRSFCAQLLANAQAAAAANKKSTAVVVVADDGVKAKAKVGRQRAAAVKPKPEPETVIEISPDTEEGGQGGETKSLTNQKNVREKSSKTKVETLTSVLTARSKVACGIKAIDDIDSADAENQLAVVDYVEDIYKFYRLMETSTRVPDYMGKQLDINDRMRSILVDWLIEVHNKFELMPETLYLTVHIIDQYLSMRTVLRRELQLVGVSAMLIASKYEEIWAPEINDFVCITDMAYTREGILRMEKSILNELAWSLTVPTPYVFLVRFLKAAKSDKEMEDMVFFYAELALMQYSMMITHCPSMIAASAVYAAQCTLKKSSLWSETLRHHTGFTETQIIDCVKLLLRYHSSAADGKLKVVYRKYSSPDRSAVALLPPADLSQESKKAAAI